MMTMEGAMSYEAFFAMTDWERLFWLQKCVDLNDKAEEQMAESKRRGRRR